MMAKIFENGRSQAVRLPKECRFDCKEVVVKRIGEMVVLIPKDKIWEVFEASYAMVSPDFMEEGRTHYIQSERESIQ